MQLPRLHIPHSLPAVAGSIADHAAMHISAVAHEYETAVRLPPAAKAR